MPLAHPDVHVDRVRAWLDDLASAEPVHGLGRLATREPDGTLTYCALGVACRTAGSTFEFDALGRPRNSYRYYAELSDWLGLDITELRVRCRELPAWLDERITGFVEIARVARPSVVVLDQWFTGCVPGEHTVWALSDYGLDFALIADALRVTLDVDPHRVPGTVEHGLCVAQEATEGDPWGDGTPELAPALSAAGAR